MIAHDCSNDFLKWHVHICWANVLGIALMHPKLCFTWQNSQRIISKLFLQRAQVVQLGLKSMWQQTPNMNPAQLDHITKYPKWIWQLWMPWCKYNIIVFVFPMNSCPTKLWWYEHAFFRVSSSLAGGALRFFFSTLFVSSASWLSFGSSSFSFFFSLDSAWQDMERDWTIAGFGWSKKQKLQVYPTDESQTMFST